MDTQTAEVDFFVIATTAILIILAVLIINLLLISRNRRLKHQTEVLEMKSNFEKELMKTQVEVAENTLNDIARDLHDDVGQMLTFSILQLNQIKPQDETNEKELKEVKTSVQSTLQSVREISKALSNDYISSFGMHESLLRLFERLERQKIISASLNFPREILIHSRSNELFAFRIIQELINNTLKHAGASQINLAIAEQDSTIHINYSDNGKGLTQEQLKPEYLKNSLGYTNIFRRVEMMKGAVKLDEKSNNGFNFTLIFPNQ